MNQTHRRRPAYLTANVIMGALMLITPAAAFADTGNTNTIKVLPATTTISPVGTGSSFTVAVVANGSVDISGAAAGLAFDNTKLTLTALAKGAAVVANGASYGGYPSSGTTASFIATANSNGQIPNIGYFYLDGTFDLANTDVTIYSATFKVSVVGDSVLTPNAQEMIDGRSATYGEALTVTTVDGTVVNSSAPAPTSTLAPSATPTPSATSTPSPTSTPTPAPSATPTPSPTSTPTPAPSATPTSTPTSTPSPTGSVEGATGTPGVTLPPTDANPTGGRDTSRTGTWLGLASLGMIGAAAVALASSRRSRVKSGRRV